MRQKQLQSFVPRLLVVAFLLAAASLIGTVGYRFIEGWSLFDSFYMTLEILTSVGFNEVHPLTFHGRVFTAFLMLIGVTVVFAAIAILGDMLIQLEMKDYFGRRQRNRMLKDISGHYIVCGAGRVGRSVVSELLRSGASIVLIDDDAERARWGAVQDVLTLIADATKDETLRQARIDTAKGLVAAIASDAENVYVALSAKVLNPGLLIAARASDDQAEEKLRRAGASIVFTPYSFVGHRLAQSMLRPHVTSFLDIASAFRRSGDFDLEIEQLQIARGSPLATERLDEANLSKKYGVIVLAIQHPTGVMQFNPPADSRMQAGDVLIAMGERAKLKRLVEEITP